jgi:hypothetical protein
MLERMWEEKEPLHTIGGNVNYSLYGNQYGGSSRN